MLLTKTGNVSLALPEDCRLNLLEPSGSFYEVFVAHHVHTSNSKSGEFTKKWFIAELAASRNHTAHLYGTIYSVTIWRNSHWCVVPCCFMASGSAIDEILPDVITSL